MIKNTFCSRCEEGFFTAYVCDNAQCPYCGFTFPLVCHSNIRTYERLTSDVSANITKGEIKLLAKAFDFSKDGIGIKVEGELHCDAGDILHVLIEDHNIDSNARVIWIDDAGHCVGLNFCS